MAMPRKEGPYPHHIIQLKNYMAILNAPYGKLLYMILGYPNVKSYFPEYLITFRPNERQEILVKLERDAAELQRGIDEKDPSLVGHIAKNPEFINKWGYNWMCSGCPYKKQCYGYKERFEYGKLPGMEEKLLAQIQKIKMLQSRNLSYFSSFIAI
jgi:hypothetical protein